MPEPLVTPAPAATLKPADTQDASLLKEAGKETPAADKSLLSEAADPQKQAQEAEEKRLLEAKDEDLSAEDKAKKAEVVKIKAEAKTKADAEAKAKEVPEKYEFKMPEGITVDQPFVDKLTPVLKGMKLSQADAQKLADVYAQHQKDTAEAQDKNFKQFLKESREETIKALGPEYKAQMAFVAKIRDKFLSTETQEMLEATGLSNNKAIIQDLIRLGQLISEDKLIDGKKETPIGTKSLAETLYPAQI